MQLLIIFATLVVTIVTAREITFINKCGETVWMSPQANEGSSDIGGIQKLDPGAQFAYNINDGGWGGRFWPKTGCDDSGQNCQVGQSTDPCPAGGCQPPADTKVEFFFPDIGKDEAAWYDISLVDGYSLPLKITPSNQQDPCVETTCSMSLNDCPQNENDVGDLRVMKDGNAVQCLSPCKKWNYPSPYGLGKDEQMDPGLHLCCPTPPIESDQCNAGPVVNTQYVNLIHSTCPSAYSFAYDDKAGLHNCPKDITFTVEICP